MGESNVGGVAWANAPEPDPRIFYPIYTPKVDRDVIVIVLSDDITGVYVHYYRGRTHPCRGNKVLCEGCDLRYDRRWKGYLACWDRPRGRLVLAEVTREAFLRCPGFVHHAQQLRGKVLRLVRAGESKNARVTAAINLLAEMPPGLPPAFDVKSALERIWFAEAQEHVRIQPDARQLPDAGQDAGQGELFEPRKDGPYA